MLQKILLSVMFVAVSSSGFAAAPAAPVVPVETKTKLAIELMQITHYDQNMQAMQRQLATMMEKQFDSLAKCDAALPVMREFSTEIGEKAATVFGSEELKIDIASVYAEVFSEDELREIIQFYQSPLGKKLLNRMPELMQKTMQMSQDRVKAMMPELQKIGEKYGEQMRDAADQCKAAESEKPTSAK